MPGQDYTTLFNTPLDPETERGFKEWASENGKMKDLYDYDLRGAYKSGVANKVGHMPDTFKKPNHPTFSSESMYSSGSMRGGQWTKDEASGRWVFEASPTNLKFHGAQELQDYFNRVEPDSALIVPGPTQIAPMIGVRG